VGIARTLLYSAATVLLMAGCAPQPPLPKSQVTTRVDVPFVPPRSERCAATSIEMVAAFWRGRSGFTPLLGGEQLDARTLLPEKAGTLQAELVAAARADGLLVYMLDPTFEALYSALEAGMPPILLLNRGLSWYALWHYAPVTGYDAEARTILSHFADRPDEAIPLQTLAALWKRGGNWGVLLLPPEFVPPLARPERWLRSAYDLERTGMVAQAITAYESGIARWADDTQLRFAYANALQASGRLREAETAYRALLERDSGHPLARNNLADLLCRDGRGDEALKLLEGVTSDLPGAASVIEATRKEILQGCPPRGR